MNIHQKQYEGREDEIWYGGDIRTLYSYIDEDNELREVEFRDKNNGGDFFHKMSNYFKNDSELNEARDNWDKDIYPMLESQDNNWWEVFVALPGEEYEFEYGLYEASGYTDAFKSLIEDFDEIIQSFKNEIED